MLVTELHSLQGGAAATTFTLSTHGMSQKDVTVIRSLLTVLQPKLRDQWRCVEESLDADVHIVDVDTDAGRRAWILLYQGLRVPLSRRRINAESLTKPVTGRRLLRTMNTLGRQLAVNQQGGKTLLDHLDEAPFALLGLIADDDVPELWVNMSDQVFLLGCELARLQDFLANPIAASQLYAVHKRDYRQRAALVKPQPLVRLRWYCACLLSQGQPDVDIERDTTYTLVEWPDMETHLADHYRLANYLSRQPATLGQAASDTGIRPAVVADFFNASRRTGLLQAVR